MQFHTPQIGFASENTYPRSTQGIEHYSGFSSEDEHLPVHFSALASSEDPIEKQRRNKSQAQRQVRKTGQENDEIPINNFMLEPWVTPEAPQDTVSGKTSSTAQTSSQVGSGVKPVAKPGVGFGTSVKTAGPGQITSKEVAMLTPVQTRIEKAKVQNENQANPVQSLLAIDDEDIELLKERNYETLLDYDYTQQMPSYIKLAK